MFIWDKKILAGIAIVFISIFAVIFAALYQPEAKTERIYKAALNDFNNGKYQNSYYLFSKISVFSNLKPVAIYHRAECAKMLGDDKSELKQYEILFNNYPKHKLSLKAKYLAGQKLIDTKPDIATKYFENIMEQAPNTDYAIASEYFLGIIKKNKYKNTISSSKKDEIENCFRHYIKKAPSGKHALNAVNNWLEISNNIAKDDYLLMANTCYLFGENEKAKELLTKTDIHDSWALDAKVSYSLKDYTRTRNLVENGVQKYSAYVDEEQIIDAIDIYNKISDSNSVIRLLGLMPSNSLKGRDYLMN